MWTQIIDSGFYLVVKMLTDCWYYSCYPVDIMMVVAVLLTEKMNKHKREENCRQLLRRLHLRLQVFIEGSNNVCFPLSDSLPHLLISPLLQDQRPSFSVSLPLLLPLFFRLPISLSFAARWNAYMLQWYKREARRNEQMLRQMGGRREVLKKQQDRARYIFNKYDHK